MQILRRKVLEELDGLMQDVVKVIKEGKETGIIDVTSLLGRHSEHLKNISMAFDDADARLKGIKEPAPVKKGLFGF